MKIIKSLFTLFIAVLCSCGSDLTYDQKMENYIKHSSESRALIEQGKYSEALYYSTAAIEITDTLSAAIYLQGVAEFGLDRFEEAEENFTRVIEMEGETSVAYKNRAKIFFNKDESDFINDINTYLENHPEDEEARTLKREYLEKKEDFDGAINEYSLAIAKNKDSIELLTKRADLHFKNGDYFKSIQDYDRILQLDPENQKIETRKAEILAFVKTNNKRNTIILILLFVYFGYVGLSFLVFKPLIRKKAINQIGGNLEIGRDPLIWALPILLTLVYLVLLFNNFTLKF